MFSRTPGGLSSVHLFYGVDVVVYCEGREGSDASSTFDEVFWASVMRMLGLRCVCKSLGSKDTVLALHSQILDNGIKNTILALDLDYDWFFETKIDHPTVIYTYGYSWESDAVSMMNMINVLNLFVSASSIDNYNQRFEEFKSSLFVTLRRVCAIDIRYVRSNSPLFDRCKPQEIIVVRPGDLPRLNIARLLNSAKAICENGLKISKKQYQNIDGMISFFGKSVSKLVYFWFVKISRDSIFGRKVSYDTFLGCLSSSFIVNESTNIGSHYRISLERFYDYSK